MSPADLKAVSNAASSVDRIESLVALLRWAISHKSPPDDEAWGGLYIVACDAETEAETARETLSEILR